MLKNWLLNFAPEQYDVEGNKFVLPIPVGTLRRFLALKKTQLRNGDTVKVKVIAGGEQNIEAVVKKYNYETNKISVKIGATIHIVGEENVISSNYVSYDAFGGYRSALKHEYQNQRVQWDNETAQVFKEIYAGYQRDVATMKQEGTMDINEGKMPITFTGMFTVLCLSICYMILINAMFMSAYRILAAAALGIALTTGAVDIAGAVTVLLWYAHVYLVLQWNLMSRTNNISTTNYEHIWWENDSLVIHVPKQKNDANGARAYPKHVFANPLDPLICPVLALALWLIGCCAHRTDNKLFDGTFCDDKFGDWLSNILSKMNQTIKDSLGIDISDIGTHSIRKGVATFESGMIGGPSMVAIFIRIG